MELDGLAALHQHQVASQLGVLDREFELVGLHRAGGFRTQARLDEFALVGLEEDALVDDVVQLSALDPFAEYEVETQIEEDGQCDDGQQNEYASEFFHDVRF